MLSRGTTSTSSRMFSIIESRKTSGLPSSSLLQAFRDALDRLAEAPVEIAHGVVQRSSIWAARCRA